MATHSSIEAFIARAARTPLALKSLGELAATLAGEDLTALVAAALDGHEIEAASAFGLVAALRKAVLPASLLERLLPEIDSIMYMAALLRTCSDEELHALVARLCHSELLTWEREALCVFVACARAVDRRVPAALVACVRKALRRRGMPEVAMFAQAAAAQLDDTHIRTMLGGDSADVVDPGVASARAQLIRRFVEEPTSLLPSQPLPRAIHGYTYVRLEREQGRNDLCACGSGTKYKRCCALRRDRPELRVSETGFMWDSCSRGWQGECPAISLSSSAHPSSRAFLRKSSTACSW